ICARRAIAGAIARPRVTPSQSTHRRAMSVSAASSEREDAMTEPESSSRNAPAQEQHPSRRNMLLAGTTLAAVSALGAAGARKAQAQAQPAAAGRKPNILVIFGDDIGIPQISAYTMGLMGYRTPNIDRIANEGAIFTDAYGQQSCTAG